VKPLFLLALSPAPLLFLASCRSPEPAPPPAAMEIAKTEPASTSTPAAAREAGLVANAGSTSSVTPLVDPPPAGTYAIAMSDRSNTCADAGAGSWSNQPLLVTIRPATGGRWNANLPVNTGVGSPAIDRHDVLLEVGHVADSVIRPDRTCAYEVSRKIEIREVGPTRIVANVRSEYTDAVRCTLPRKPVSCIRDVDVTYTLVNALCPPRCIAQPKPVLRDGGIEATCICPDGGAP